MSDEEEVSVENEYVVEKILDKRGHGKKVEYLIKWRGYDDPKENTWEPVENCDCPDLIEEFEAAYALKKQKSKQDKPKESRGTRANTKSAEPDGKRDRKRKATVEPPQPLRKKKTSPPKSRILVRSSSSSDSDSDGPTTSVKKGGENGDNFRPKDSSTPQQNLSKTEESVVPRFTPVDHLPPLDFVVKKIEGITGKPPDRHYVVVRTEENTLKTAEIKSVAKQNFDMMLDYLLARLEEKR